MELQLLPFTLPLEEVDCDVLPNGGPCEVLLDPFLRLLEVDAFPFLLVLDEVPEVPLDLISQLGSARTAQCGTDEGRFAASGRCGFSAASRLCTCGSCSLSASSTFWVYMPRRGCTQGLFMARKTSLRKATYGGREDRS